MAIARPTDIANCAIWLDASDTTTLFQLSGGTVAVAASGDPIGYWGDKSGNNRHFTNIGGTAATRPTWVDSLSTIRFNGSSYLTSFFNLTYTTQTVFVVVLNSLHDAQTRRMYSQAAAGAADTATFSPVFVSPNVGAAYSSYASTTERSTVSYRSLNIYNILTCRHTGSEIRNFCNGQRGAISAHTLGSFSVVCSRLGAGISNGTTGAVAGNSTITGNLGEVIVYNSSLNQDEINTVESYLYNKWKHLNSFPRFLCAESSGTFNDTNRWLLSGALTEYELPRPLDTVSSNTFIVTITGDTQVENMTNGTIYGGTGGGRFILDLRTNSINLTANVRSNQWTGGGTVYGLSAIGSQTLNMSGSILANDRLSGVLFSNSSTGTVNITGSLRAGGTNSHSLLHGTSGTVNIFGELRGGEFGHAVYNNTTGTVNVSGAVRGSFYGAGGSGYGIFNNSSGSINVTGIVEGGSLTSGAYGIYNNSTGRVRVNGIVSGSSNEGSSPGIVNISTGAVEVTGNVLAGNSVGISNTGNSLIRIQGNVFASPFNHGIGGTSTTVPLTVVGDLYGSSTGRPALYAARYLIQPTGVPQFTRQATNRFNNFVDFYTSDATFTYPTSTDVRQNTTYSNNTLTGSMIVPPASSVYFGVRASSSTGTGYLSHDNLWNVSIPDLTVSNSIGKRLKNSVTTSQLSAIVDSLNSN